MRLCGALVCAMEWLRWSGMARIRTIVRLLHRAVAVSRNPQHSRPFQAYTTLASRSCRLGGSWLAVLVAVSLARPLDSSPSWPVPVWLVAKVWQVDGLHA